MLRWLLLARDASRESLRASTRDGCCSAKGNSYGAIRCCYPIDYGLRTIDGPVDLDLHVALLARNGKLRFDELPIPLTSQELVRLSMKSAALWSLLSMAQQHDIVALVCDQESKKPGGTARQHLGNARRTNG